MRRGGNIGRNGVAVVVMVVVVVEEEEEEILFVSKRNWKNSI